MIGYNDLFHRKQELQNFNCIYFLFKGSHIVYIGQSRNGIGRVYQHVPQKEFDSFSYVLCELSDMNNLEAEYIAQFAPELNCVMPMNDNFKSMMQLKNILKRGTLELKKIIRTHKISSYFHGEYYKIKEIEQYLLCEGE